MENFIEVNKDQLQDFFVDYWSQHLKLDDANRKKCQKYATALVNEIQSFKNEEKILVELEPQLKMMADILLTNNQWQGLKDWQGCKEYLSVDETEPKLPAETMNITKIHEMFIQKRRNIFMCKGKGDQFDEFHRAIALKMILDETECKLFSCHRQSNKTADITLLELGTVRKLDEEFHFVHKTFAHYFFADVLLTELALNHEVEFQKFLIEKVFFKPEFKTSRKFFEDNLPRIGHSLPYDILQHYQSLASDVTFEDTAILVHLLAKEGRMGIIQLLLKCIDFRIIKDKEISVGDFTEADFNKHDPKNVLNGLRYLTRRGGVNIKDRTNKTPLHYAAEEGHSKLVKFLVEKGANVDIRDSDGEVALHSAISTSQFDIVKYFTEIGVDVDVKDNDNSTALHLTSWYGRLDAVKVLVQLDANINSARDDGATPLILAATRGFQQIVEFLVQRGADVYAADERGDTALHLAASRGHFDTVKYLVEYGIDVNIKDYDGETPLHLAALSGELDVAKYLVECGADIDIVSDKGATMLHFAALGGELDIVKFFLELGGDLYALDRDGRTVVHEAAATGSLDVVKFFVARGVDARIRDKNGRMAVDEAAEDNQVETVGYLEGLGG